jgi:hypothetical protein
MKNPILLLLCTFIVSVACGQSTKSTLLERNNMNSIESLRALNSRNNPFNEEGVQSNFNKILTPFTKRNNNFLSRRGENVLRLDSIVEVEFDTNYKYEIIYNTSGNNTLFLDYKWSTDSESFVLNQKSESTYDANGNQTMYMWSTWNTNSQSFTPSSKTEFTYNADGNKILGMRYQWNTDSQSFVPNSKIEFYYDDNENPTQEINYQWITDSESFVPSSKYEYTYDDNGNLTLWIYSSWKSDSQSFVLNSKNESTYDGNRTLRVYYYLDYSSQSLVPGFKYEYADDASGNRILYIRYEWNTDSESFIPTSKEEYTYDYTKIIPRTEHISYLWFPSLGVFKPSNKKEYTIILDNETNAILMGTISKYDTNFNQWTEVAGEEFKSYEYYTKAESLSTEVLNETLFLIYPNPVKDKLFIQGVSNPLKVSIYNLLGKKVLSIKNTNNINVQSLPSGVYTIRISDGVGQTNRKFIKN